MKSKSKDPRPVIYFSAKRVYHKGKFVFGLQVGYDLGDPLPVLVVTIAKWMVIIGPHYGPLPNLSQD
jgi:hypothetical protein